MLIAGLMLICITRTPRLGRLSQEQTRKSPANARLCEWLPLKDSNLEQQSQNLLCYHYTKG